MLSSQHFNMYSNTTGITSNNTRVMWIAILVFFNIANIGSAYRIVFMGSANDEVKAKANGQAKTTFAIILSKEQVLVSVEKVILE